MNPLAILLALALAGPVFAAESGYDPRRELEEDICDAEMRWDATVSVKYLYGKDIERWRLHTLCTRYKSRYSDWPAQCCKVIETWLRNAARTR